MSLMNDAQALQKDFDNIDKNPRKKLNEGKTISRKKISERRKKIKEQSLKFSDGVEIDVSGKMRTEKYKDGWYVVGDGKLIPVKSKEEGEKIIAGIYTNESTMVKVTESEIYKNLRRQKLKGSVASRIKNGIRKGDTRNGTR